jgi:hypothetical protein
VNNSYHKPTRGRRVSLPIAWLERVALARVPDSARAILLDMLPSLDDRGRACSDAVGVYQRPDGSVRARSYPAIERAAGQLMQAGLIEPAEWRWESENGGAADVLKGWRIMGFR